MRNPFDSVSGAFSDLAHTEKRLMMTILTLAFSWDFWWKGKCQNRHQKLFFRMSYVRKCPPSKFRIIWLKSLTFVTCIPTHFFILFTTFFHFICRFPVPTAPQSLSSLIREKHFQYLTSKMMKKSRYSESMGFRELQKKCNANDLYKTFIFQWKSSYLTLRDLPYGPA